MARILIVGCGCRGQSLARALIARGHVVRGTTRLDAGVAAIERAGAEARIADPGALATLQHAIDGASVTCWLMGGVDVPALHGPRLETQLRKLVDTHVRGFVYEASGSARAELLAGGAQIVRSAADTFAMPVALIRADPTDHDAWLVNAVAAVDATLAA